MNKQDKELMKRAKEAAIKVLLNNMHGEYQGLPRTAAWGYPEPYTRDLMIASLGILVTGNEEMIKSLRLVLETTASNQSKLGQIPSLVHDPNDCGSSDCTPLFLMAVGIFRQVMKEPDFLDAQVHKALTWMQYQRPTEEMLIAQLPTTDWRDEQWVLGYGLFVNTVVYSYMKFLGQDENAEALQCQLKRFTIKCEEQNRHIHKELALRNKPYYALWSFKIYQSERFDLLGNSLAILSGIASPSRAVELIKWIEGECEAMRKKGVLAVDLPPNFFPYIKPEDSDWLVRYEKYNKPGDYHNGGIWPFICGFYIAALVAAKQYKLAEEKLFALTKLIQLRREADVEFGFNEWHKAQDGKPKGQDWQTWSAAMYVYAAECVERKETPFFNTIGWALET